MTNRDGIVALVLALLAAGSCFLGTSRTALVDTDEPRYAETARVMLETGDWLHPSFGSEPRHAKPALTYWLIALSYRAFGVTEFAARFPSGVFCVLIALGLFLVGRRLGGTAAGGAAALVWATLVQTGIWARACLTDNILTFWIAGACVALWFGGAAEPRRKLWPYLAAAALMALADLTKGPVGIIIPIAVWGVRMLARRRLRAELRHGSLWLAAAALIALTAPWYVLQLLAYGGDYSRSFLGADNIGRFLHAPPHEVAWWSPFYYLPVLLIAGYPWTSLLPLAWGELRSQPSERPSPPAPLPRERGARTHRGRGEGGADGPGSAALPGLDERPGGGPGLAPWAIACRRFAAQQGRLDGPHPDPLPGGEGIASYLTVWFLVPVVLFSLSGTKFPQYIQSAYPAAALLIGLWAALGRAVAAPAWRRAAAALLVTSGAIVAAAAIAMPRLIEADARRRATTVPAELGLVAGAVAVVCVGLAGATVLALRWGKLRALVHLALAGWLVPSVFLFCLGPFVIAYRAEPFRQAGLALRAEMPPTGRIYTYGHGVRSSALVFYSRHNMTEVPVGHPDLIRRAMRERDVVVTRPDRVGELSGIPGLEVTDTYSRWVMVLRRGAP